MRRGRPRKNKEVENNIKEEVVKEIKVEENKIDNKDYYAFKYTKNKQGSYEGYYLCCNSKQLMIRLVKNWNKELDVYGFGPYEKKKRDILIPPFDDIKNNNYTP